MALKRSTREVELQESFVLERFVEPVRLNLMTPLFAETSTPGIVHLRSLRGVAGGERHYVLRYDAAKFRATAEEIPIQDARLRSVWGDRLARVVLTGRATALRDSYRVVLRYAE